jgi:hypothetical protein
LQVFVWDRRSWFRDEILDSVPHQQLDLDQFKKIWLQNRAEHSKLTPLWPISSLANVIIANSPTA